MFMIILIMIPLSKGGREGERDCDNDVSFVYSKGGQEGERDCDNHIICRLFLEESHARI